MNADIKQIADHYGAVHQLKKAKEELGECCEAIDDVLYDNMMDADSLEHLAEEIADARIMLEQLEYLLDLQSRIGFWRAHKLARQLFRMQDYDGGII